MTISILFVLFFTFIIHTINTLAYAVRLVGIETGRLTVSFSLFNILVLLSRTANALQVPLLAKKVETDIALGPNFHSLYIFHYIIAAATLGTLTGAVLMPSFRQLLVRFVYRFNAERSIPRVILHSFSKSGIKQFRKQLRMPNSDHFNHLKNLSSVPWKIITLNLISVAVLTAGSLAALSATYYNPELRVTASSMAPLITGIATIILVIFVDPYFSLLTDDVIEGVTSPYFYSKCIVYMIISRTGGTLIAQLLLYPLAQFILVAAELI